MRVALVTDWFPPRRGGIEAQLAELATRLAHRGHDVCVLTTTPAGGVEATDAPFRVRRLDLLRVPGAGIAISPRLPWSVARELAHGADVVHCHASVVSPLAYAGVAAARGMGLPTVVTFHSMLRHKRHVLRAASAVARLSESPITWTAVSGTVASQAQLALSAPVTLLPNGVSLGFWRDALPAAKHGRITLVSAGRLERKKRPLVLVRAFLAAVRRARVDARLLLAGDGSARTALNRAVADAGARERIQILGWQTPEQLRALYAGAQGFAMASERESFGIAALEARASGLPVIAMQSAGCSDFLSHDSDALLCADDADLAEQLARFLGDGDLRARLASAHVRLDRYDWDSVVGEHERAYERAVSRVASARAVASSA